MFLVKQFLWGMFFFDVSRETIAMGRFWGMV